MKVRTCKDCDAPLSTRSKSKPIRCRSCARKEWWRRNREETENYEPTEEELEKLIEERRATMPGRKK